MECMTAVTLPYVHCSTHVILHVEWQAINIREWNCCPTRQWLPSVVTTAPIESSFSESFYSSNLASRATATYHYVHCSDHVIFYVRCRTINIVVSCCCLRRQRHCGGAAGMCFYWNSLREKHMLPFKIQYKIGHHTVGKTVQILVRWLHVFLTQ